ncbi:hypothetical protein FRC00_011272 [Tulasnella sp. 408]|nr:hypothetical protein FRC00_011272 [Tulasnella sp. 408]
MVQPSILPFHRIYTIPLIVTTALFTMLHFPHVNANHMLSPSRQARLPILNGQQVCAILCPRHLDRGIHIALEPKVCNGTTTPANKGRVYWQCDRTCKAYDWVPDDYGEVAPHLLPPVPRPAFGPPPPSPPFPPAQDPVRVNAFFDHDFDADPFEIHFPSSSPPDRARNSLSSIPSASIASTSSGLLQAAGQHTVPHNGSHSLTQVPSSSRSAALPPPLAPPSSLPSLPATSLDGKLCPHCRKAKSNTKCAHNACQRCCHSKGGCTRVYAHRLTTQQKEIDRRTKRAADFIHESPSAPSLTNIPPSVSTLATLVGVDLPSQPVSTAVSSSSSQPASTAASSSASVAQHRYAESLDPTWAAWRGERMQTREKAFQEHEARRAKNVVDMVNFNVIVWTAQDQSFIELERQVARRLARSWSFGEDATLCEVVGLNKATKFIYKYTEDREGNCRWTTVEFTHAFTVHDNGYYLFAFYNLETASLINFRQVASLVAPPSRNLMNRRPRPLASSSSTPSAPQSSAPPSTTTSSASATETVASRPKFSLDIPGRARRTVEVVVPTLDPALKRTYRHVPTPESPVAKRLKPDQAPTGSPEKPIDVDLEPDSTSAENADPNTSLVSVASTAADATLESVPSASNRSWPHRYSVHEVIKGFKYIDSTLGRLPEKFRDAFKTQFVKATYHTYRNAWNNLSDERRKEILALPDDDDALFHKVFNLPVRSRKPPAA